MASTRIQTVPSSSTSTFSKPQPKYDVFLSFSGEDTRHQFTDHLYHALKDKEIITFKDDKELKKGEPISQELLDAIEKSRIAVIILSKNYASSTWCLEELAKIVECRERRILTVLPIFYHVEPTDVRYQKKTFEEAFAKHEIRYKENPKKVLKWRAALTNVANLSGEPLKDGAHEAKFIRSIVLWLYSELKDKRPKDIEDDLVGIKSRVDDMISYLDMESTDVHFIGMCETSGMGKTTLARALFDKILDQFEACSFLENVTEVSKAHGIKTLQEQLLCDISKGGLRVKYMHKESHVISNILRNRKVLIVVDDVSEKSQLETLVGKRDWFGQGSRIIVITEDEDLLASLEIKMIYKAKELNTNEALQLFSLNAFRKPHCENDFLRKSCENDFMEYINNFVKYAHGIPLVLKVLGSYLCTRTKKEWERAQNQLRAISPEKTTKKLRIAFDGLEADEKKLFLDIACFFKGEEKSRIANLLESDYFSNTNLKNLIDKSLITLVEGGKLWMHSLLQKMGFEIVIKKSKVVGGRSRLWLCDDVLDVLKNNTGTKHIKGMLLRLPPDEEEEELNAESFTKMNKLRLLKMCKVCLPCLSYLSNELRLLEWHDYPLESLPKSFQPGELVELIMHRSRIQQLPSEFGKLGKLKLIDLSYSPNLTHTPDFTEFSNIERLNFQGCTRLHELHTSFGRLKRLFLLNLKDCKRHKNLPRELNLESLKILILSGCSRFKKFPGIGRKMTSLSELYLDGTAIEELPPTIRRLTGLTLLNLQDCKNIKSFPSDIHSLTSLEILTLSGCKCQPPKAGHLLGLSPIGSSIGATLTFPRLISFLFLSFLAWRYTYLRIPVFATTVLSTYCFHNARHPEPEPINLLLSNSFSKLSTLVSLDLSDCNLLALPDDLSCLSSLKYLNLSKNNFACLPDCISQLSKLKILFLDHCSKLKSLPYVPLSTQFVSAQGCTSLENYSNQVVLWTSGVAGFTIINCLGLAEDEDGKIAEVSLLDIPLFWQRYVKDQIHQMEGFCHVLPQPEIPEWFKHQKLGSFAPIPLPSNLFSDINWKGIALCVIFVVPSNLNDVSPGQDTKYFHEFQCRLDIEGDLIVFKVPKETYVGSFGLWLYLSHMRFGKHLNERSCITPLIGTNRPDIEIKMCGARILYEQDMGEFLQNLSQEIFESPNDLCGELKSLLSSLYQVDWARNHLYDYIFPQIACPPRWFAYQNKTTISMQLPSNLHDNSRWLGFTIYALYTTQMQRNGFKCKQDSTIFLRYYSLSASDEVPFAPYTAFPLSGDVFDESSLRLVVFYIPRLLFQLNRCSHIEALFESNDPCVQVEKCGIRLVYTQDVAEFVQALVEYMLGSPDTNHHSFSKNLSHQLGKLQDCNHEKDYCCSFLPERRLTPMPKLLPSNETIQGECTSRESIFSNQVIAAGTSKNSSRRSIYLGKISSSLECWPEHGPYLQDHYEVPGNFNQCLPQSEIPRWFKSENIARSSSVTIQLPPNLYDNPEWMGFAFCAVFSFQKQPTSIRMKGSGFSFIIVCHLKNKFGCMNPLYSISEEDVIISLHQRAFLWLSFIPCWFLSPKLSRCTLVEFSFLSDSSDVSALKCGVDLVYRPNFEITRTMVERISSYEARFTSYGRFPFHRPNQFSGSDGSSGTSGHYSNDQFYRTAALDRYNIFNLCPQSEIPEWFSHDLLQSDLSPKFDFHPSTSYNFCFPPSKIQDWFSHPNRGHSVTIDLPSNLYHDSNWMGLVLYASFSIHGDPNIIFSNLVSGKSHFLYCQCQTSMANVDNQTIAFSTNKEEITWLLNLGEFIWICYVPGEPFKNMLPHCCHIEASFVSDWPGVRVQNCALQLLYQHEQVQFEQELKHCNNLISQKQELVRKQLEDQKKINEQYHVDEGLQRIIFSNIDFEVKIFPRLIDQPATNETETQLGQSDLLENQEKVDNWRVTPKEVTKISGEHLEKRSDEDEAEDSGKQFFSPSSEYCHDNSDIDSSSLSARHEFYSCRSVGSSPSDSPSRINFTYNRVGHSVQQGQEGSPFSQNVGPFNQPTMAILRKPDLGSEDPDNNDDCSDDLAIFRNQNEKSQRPLDFDKNGLMWFPPLPDDENDESESDFSSYDDDDDDNGDSFSTFSSSSSLVSVFSAKEKQNEGNKEPLRAVVHRHFRALVSQLLQGEGIKVGKENDVEDWLDIVTTLAWQAANFFIPDTSRGGSVDPVGYVKVKCAASGSPSESTLIKGVVCTKNIKHKRMTPQYKNPRLLLLGGALEYQKVPNELASCDTLLQQEKDHLKMIISKIETLRPNVLLVEKSVSSYAQEQLQAREISLVLNVKRPLLERIAQCTGAIITPSIDEIPKARLGLCELFRLERVSEEHETANQFNKKPSKTLMFFEGCPSRLACTVLLKGTCHDELKKVKHVVQHAVFAAYHLSLETSFLADEGASLAKMTLKHSISVPERTTTPDLAISVVPNSLASTSCPALTDDSVQDEEIVGLNPEIEGLELLGRHLDPVHPTGSMNCRFGNAPTDACYDDLASCVGLESCTLNQCEDFKGPRVFPSVMRNLSQQEPQESMAQDETLAGEMNGSTRSERADEIEVSSEYFSAAETHQSILVSFSSHCVLKGIVCERSRLLRIKFYGCFDKPLGRYLRDDLFVQACCSRSCKEPVEAHVLCFTHQQGNLTINVRCLPDIILPGERDGKIWMWHRCLRCAHVDGVPPATRRVVMSDAAWGLSFGKFLELSFSNHGTANRVEPCGHSLQRDCLRYYGFGSMVAFFRYSPIDILSVHLPPLVLEFNGDVPHEWTKKEAAELVHKMETLYAEISDVLDSLEEKCKSFGNECSDTNDLQGHIMELKDLRKKERNDYNGLLQPAIMETSQPDWLAGDILELNRLRRSLLVGSHVWDQRLCSLDSLLKKSSISKAAQGDASYAQLKEPKSELSHKDGMPGTGYEDSDSSKLHEPPGNNLQSEQAQPNVPPFEPSVAVDSMLTTCHHHVREEEKHSDGEVSVNKTLSESLSPNESTLSERMDSAWTGTNQPAMKEAHSSHEDELQAGSVRQISQNDNPPIRRLMSPVRVYSFDSALRVQERIRKGLPPSSLHLSALRSFHASGDYRSIVRDPVSNVMRTYSQMLPWETQKLNLTGGSTPSFISHMAEGARLLLTQNGHNDLVIAVYENEPTSIISYALSSKEYNDWVADNLNEHEGSWSLHESSKEDSAVSTFSAWQLEFDYIHYGSYGSEDASSSMGTFFKDPKRPPHLTISFEDEFSTAGGKVKFSVTCYFAKQFDSLRKKCCPSEVDFVRSLSRGRTWSAQGGKSNVYIAKSLDERFIIKQVTKTELDSFVDFAPQYFKYLTESLSSRSPTCLAKILGIYQVSVKHLKGGKETKMDLMVMENLFFKRNISRVYDLKGSARARYNSDTTGANKVLLDLNLLETLRTKPIFLGSKAKRSLERAVLNDTSFLASVHVMDYSLLVGVDNERKELVLGIIDFMRQYTWDKHLETWVKASGILGGPTNASPTIISPKQYKKRFRKAMTTYFLTVPDQWSS